MGWNNMFLVAKSLEKAKGARIEIADWDDEKSIVVPPGRGGKPRTMNSYDLALLYAIAYRQHDEDPDHGWTNDKCFCYGSSGDFAALSCMSTKQVPRSRAFLQTANLISYRQYDMCYDLKNPNKREEYKYVYRLNKATLAMLGHVHKHDDLLPCRTPPPTVEESTSHTIGPNNTYNKTENTTKNNRGGGEVVDENKMADRCKQYIVKTCNLTPEQAQQINVRGVKAGIAKKRPEDIRKKINEFANDSRLKKSGQFNSWIGSLINALKELPEMSGPPPSLEEMEKHFSDPIPVSNSGTANQSPDDLEFQNGWERLLVHQDLTDKKDDKLIKSIKDAYNSAFGQLSGQSLKYEIKSLLEKLPSPPAENMEERIKIILEELNNVARSAC